MVAKALGKAERLLAKILAFVVVYRGLFNAQIVLRTHSCVTWTAKFKIVISLGVTCRLARGVAKDTVEVKGKREESRQYQKNSIKRDSGGEDWMELDWT